MVAVGESGGGPHTLALAYVVPDRLHGALVIGGLGPAHEPGVREGMKPDNRKLITLAQRAPWLLRLQMWLLARSLRTPAKAERCVDAPRKPISAPGALSRTGWLLLPPTHFGTAGGVRRRN